MDNNPHVAAPRKLPLPPKLASLPPKLKVFIKHDVPPTAEELGRPARVQASPEDLQKTAYQQGQEEYNIWYGKYATPRIGENGRRERTPALTHGNIFKDAGFTRANLSPTLASNPICIYFAKGCCTNGHECNYYHRLPTQLDSDNLDYMHDIFGRERHAQQRDDMEGVGSFNSPSKTLFVGDYKMERGDPEFLSYIEQQIINHFSIYGPIEEVRAVPNKNFSFVTFCYRAAAEYAKVAMGGWHFEDSDEVLVVRWAQGDRNPQQRARQSAREYVDARRIVLQRMRQMELEEEDRMIRSQKKLKKEEANEPDCDNGNMSVSVKAAEGETTNELSDNDRSKNSGCGQQAPHEQVAKQESN